MFTGIVESTGQVADIEISGTNKTFWIQSRLSHDFKVDQSIAHDGVCLTVEDVKENRHKVTAIAETLQKSNLNNWEKGSLINLEQSLQPMKRLDGHFVQGHVDSVGKCLEVVDKNGSYDFTFSFPQQFAPLVIEKGSISLNGISLTIFNVTESSFTVSIIPYTFEHTNIKQVKKGNVVNLEFDMLGKYILRKLSLEQSAT
jgi:riboflavin synthase